MLTFNPTPSLPSPSPSLTLQFRAAVLAVVVLAVGGAVLHLWDADQELAVVPEDSHGQFAPALLHQVLGLQQGEILCRHAIDLIEGDKSFNVKIKFKNKKYPKTYSNLLCYILQESKCSFSP